MRNSLSSVLGAPDKCRWVPRAALHYIAHTEGGTSIRALARLSGCHASTVSRQVRSVEIRRDCLLVDEGLRRLGAVLSTRSNTTSAASSWTKEKRMAALAEIVNEDSALTDDRFDREARRILRRLCERSAVLAVAADMDKAVVVRETEAGQNRTAVADREIAEALALKDWIACDKPGRIARYAITSAGRMALSHLVAKSENDAKRFSETEAAFCGDLADDEGETTGKRRVRYGVTETPMVLLSRRRDKDGERFLSSNLVRAGERLREDFEMAQIELDTEEGCDSLMQNWAEDDHDETVSLASAAAKKRVRHALRDLGPGLSDVVLRCCCYLQGLETIEKQMGWSARSGKIVLRIALQRLRRHYEDQGESAGMMG